MNTNEDGGRARLVERIRHGRSTVIVGALPPLPPSIDVVRVRCDLPGTLRPLFDEPGQLSSGPFRTAHAAMRLNDHAALHLRIGRGRKARELLIQSLDLLSVRVKEAPEDAAALADLADTHHLLAKLPLHASPGEAGASEIAARLEAKLGHTDAARRSFDEAMHVADAVSDPTGLARIAAGLAELLASTGRTRDALGSLASSIELNREADLERTRKRLAAAIEEVSP